MRALAVRVALLVTLLPSSALADNCSGLGDCYTVLRAALAAMVGLAVLAILIGAFPIFGTVLGMYGLLGAVTGRDPITGERLATWERVLGALPLGALGARGASLVIRTAGARPGLGGSFRKAIGELLRDQTGSIPKVSKALPIPKVSDGRLQNLVNDLYKGAKTNNPIGTGSTADAIRHEIATGQPVGGRLHTTKGREYARALEKWLRRSPDASYYDRLVAQSLLDDLLSALGGR